MVRDSRYRINSRCKLLPSVDRRVGEGENPRFSRVEAERVGLLLTDEMQDAVCRETMREDRATSKILLDEGAPCLDLFVGPRVLRSAQGFDGIPALLEALLLPLGFRICLRRRMISVSRRQYPDNQPQHAKVVFTPFGPDRARISLEPETLKGVSGSIDIPTGLAAPDDVSDTSIRAGRARRATRSTITSGIAAEEIVVGDRLINDGNDRVGVIDEKTLAFLDRSRDAELATFGRVHAFNQVRVNPLGLSGGVPVSMSPVGRLNSYIYYLGHGDSRSGLIVGAYVGEGKLGKLLRTQGNGLRWGGHFACIRKFFFFHFAVCWTRSLALSRHFLWALCGHLGRAGQVAIVGRQRVANTMAMIAPESAVITSGTS